MFTLFMALVPILTPLEVLVLLLKSIYYIVLLVSSESFSWRPEDLLAPRKLEFVFALAYVLEINKD